MPRVRLLTLSLTVALCALTSHVGAQTAPVPTISAKVLPPPVQIVRKPATLIAPVAPLTNRVLPPATVTQLISSGLKLNVGSLKPVAKPPGQKALIIVMYNGGIVKNIDPNLQQKLQATNLTTVTCGNFEFQLQPNETLQALLGQIGSLLGGNLQCINPANWHQQTLNLADWLNGISNQALENAVTGAQSLINTQSYYDKVVVMRDQDAVPANVIAMVRQLAPDYVLDIHVLTHGGNGFIAGFNEAAFNNSTFFSVLKGDKDAGKPLYLHAIYQMNCEGGTLKNAWLSLGVTAVNGTEGTNLNNMPQQYFHFLQHWFAQQQGESSASTNSFNDAAAYTRPIYDLIGMGDKVDSSKLTTVGPTPNTTVTSGL